MRKLPGPPKRQLPVKTAPPLGGTAERQQGIELPPEIELVRREDRDRTVGMIVATGCGVWCAGVMIVGFFFLHLEPRWFVTLAAFGPPAALAILRVALD